MLSLLNYCKEIISDYFFSKLFKRIRYGLRSGKCI